MLTCAVVFGLEIAFYLNVHVKAADFYALLIGSPLISTVVMVYVYADATGDLCAAGTRWERIIERAWAMIVIDVAITFVQETSLAMLPGPGFSTILAGFLALLFTAMLVYAEPFICSEKGVGALVLIPLSLYRSMILAWVNMSRIFALFAVVLAIATAFQLIDSNVHGPEAERTVWIALALPTFVMAPLAALFTVAFLDTLAQERAAAG